ncbi:MAG: methylenetetrahydrofolate reductase C-terminal domain-containing protein [Candidatus Omnitrophica bacterium]|nr:methylenetetrahydrofolate reductase C-terminal domain-containing protein [Candidatus Omnitrophota bacterium]
MIITKKKKLEDILQAIGGGRGVFIVGCGECSATSKTGGEAEVLSMQEALQKHGFNVTGYVVPDAPCFASKVRVALAKNKKALDAADSILVLACGLGAQSVKDNLVAEKAVHIGCDTVSIGQVDKDGMFLERCSACGECLLELTDMICPVTRCAKGLLNGPCGGQDKGKCETDRTKDCAWVLIYKSLKKKDKLHLLKQIKTPKAFSKMLKPRYVNPAAG